MPTCALIVAGGRSLRLGGSVPKQYRTVAGRPLLSWTIARFEVAESIDEIAVVAADDYLLHVTQKVVEPYGFRKVNRVVAGGDTRRESVLKGLRALPRSTSYVAIHDGARPLVRPADIDTAVALARTERAAMLAVPVSDTVKRVRDRYVLATLEREGLWLAQTPQVFQYDLIMELHEKYNRGELDCAVTDDAALVEAGGFKIRVLESTGPNPKVTSRHDLAVVAALLGEENDGAT
jgi:2-C-methyl-D-erythritol 4-phosphate cytidylyltransferase